MVLVAWTRYAPRVFRDANFVSGIGRLAELNGAEIGAVFLEQRPIDGTPPQFKVAKRSERLKKLAKPMQGCRFNLHRKRAAALVWRRLVAIHHDLHGAMPDTVNRVHTNEKEAMPPGGRIFRTEFVSIFVTDLGWKRLQSAANICKIAHMAIEIHIASEEAVRRNKSKFRVVRLLVGISLHDDFWLHYLQD